MRLRWVVSDPVVCVGVVLGSVVIVRRARWGVISIGHLAHAVNIGQSSVDLLGLLASR